MRHQWKQEQTWGVASGSGRPHGVDEAWTCERCGAQKCRGPQSTHTGRRVIRWAYRDGNGYRADALPACR